MSRDVGNQIMDMVGGLSAIILKLITRNTYLKRVLEGTTKERESVMKAIDEGFLDKVGQQIQVPTFAQAAQSTPTGKSLRLRFSRWWILKRRKIKSEESGKLEMEGSFWKWQPKAT